jgi:hypothetical protein
MNARNKEVVPPVFTGDCLKVIRSVVLEKKQKDFVAPACYEPETHCYVY